MQTFAVSEEAELDLCNALERVYFDALLNKLPIHELCTELVFI